MIFNMKLSVYNINKIMLNVKNNIMTPYFHDGAKKINFEILSTWILSLLKNWNCFSILLSINIEKELKQSYFVQKRQLFKVT